MCSRVVDLRHGMASYKIGTHLKTHLNLIIANTLRLGLQSSNADQLRFELC